MKSRMQLLSALAFALAALAGPQLLAADGKAHDATVIRAGGGKITLALKGNDKKHTHDVAKDAKITLDDKNAMLEDLKEGIPVKVKMDDKSIITEVEAHSAAFGEYVLTVEGMT